MTDRHIIFASFHHSDEFYKNRFEFLFKDVYDVLESKSVKDGDIDPTLKTETIRQIIRDEFIRSASVTIVLISTETWKRKYIDWEISSSIRQTKFNPRTGLIGILLPTYSKIGIKSNEYHIHTIPPWLYDNVKCGFAEIYEWTEDSETIKELIHKAYLRKSKVDPNNSRDLFKNNHSGEQWSD